MGRAVLSLQRHEQGNRRKKPSESQKAKALWAMKAVKDRCGEYFDPARKEDILGRTKTRLELWEEHLKDTQSVKLLGESFLGLAFGSSFLWPVCVCYSIHPLECPGEVWAAWRALLLSYQEGAGGGFERGAIQPLCLCGNAQGVCADSSAPFWQQKVKRDLVAVSLLISETCGGKVALKARNRSVLARQAIPPSAVRCMSTRKSAGL